MLKLEFYSVSHSTFLTVANKEVVDGQPAVAAVVRLWEGWKSVGLPDFALLVTS